MANRNPQDHNELEPMTAESWDQVLAELNTDCPGVGDTIGAWMESHRGHMGTFIRWWKPEGSPVWSAHGRCNGCRVDSRQHVIGSD